MNLRLLQLSCPCKGLAGIFSRTSGVGSGVFSFSGPSTWILSVMRCWRIRNKLMIGFASTRFSNDRLTLWRLGEETFVEWLDYGDRLNPLLSPSVILRSRSAWCYS